MIVIDQKQIKISDNRLVIWIPEGDDLGIKLIVEHKETNDDIVDLVHYTTRTVIDQEDITSILPTPIIELQDMELKVLRPMDWKMKFIGFKKDFTVTQFTDEKKSEAELYNTTIIGARIIYLLVPKDLEVSEILNKSI